MTGPLAILGPGTLGLSAAQWAVECGMETRLLGRDLSHVRAGLHGIQRRWDKAVDRGRLSLEEKARFIGRLRAAPLGIEALEGVVSLLKALPEDPGLKAAALTSAAQLGPQELPLLTGTSALPISDVARKANLVGRMVGFHLFVPVPRMAVVEMAVASGTPENLVARTRALGEFLRKRVVRLRDQPGFAVARMALAQGLEAIRLLEEGVASAEDPDALMTLGYGHPSGPLELADRVGLDLRLRISEALVAAGEERFRPPVLLRSKGADGALGFKTRRGFYLWDTAGSRS